MRFGRHLHCKILHIIKISVMSIQLDNCDVGDRLTCFHSIPLPDFIHSSLLGTSANPNLGWLSVKISPKRISNLDKTHEIY